MAKCEKCGNQYYSKECPYCKEIAWRKSQGINKTVNINKNKMKSKIIATSLISIIAIIGFIIYNINSNPLIGKWKSNNRSLMGTIKIEFKENKMIFMGIVTKVKYEKDGNEVTVIDDTGTGMIYKIIDSDTIENNLMGLKTIYKRVN